MSLRPLAPVHQRIYTHKQAIKYPTSIQTVSKRPWRLWDYTCLLTHKCTHAHTYTHNNTSNHLPRTNAGRPCATISLCVRTGKHICAHSRAYAYALNYKIEINGHASTQAVVAQSWACARVLAPYVALAGGGGTVWGLGGRQREGPGGAAALDGEGGGVCLRLRGCVCMFDG